jgi:predicted NAD/FAD-dependent oxidoreductase
VTTVVVGAGLAGLLCARTLHDAGRPVVVLDKGRSPGGRLATRRIGDATLDHGAQFFTVRSDTFGSLVRGWEAAGIVWSTGFGDHRDGHPRYMVDGGMNALTKHLAAGLDVRCGAMAFAVHRDGERWRVALDDGSHVAAEALVLTCPTPQSLALLVTAGVTLPEPLRTLDYDRTLALLAVLDRPAALPPPGALQEPGGNVAFVADNQAKGVSAQPALTLHATAAWSLQRWDDDRDAVHADLLAMAAPFLGPAQVLTSQVKRWRFATPQHPWPDPCWAAPDVPAPLVLAGDAFGGPRVEGAACSGLAAAAALAGR